MTMFDGIAAFIVHNTSLSKKRQAADLAHEIAHILLRHEPKTIHWKDGQRHYDAESEEEAKWLGPALLISEEAALKIVRSNMSLPVASNMYQVSEQLVQMRINVTGAKRRYRT